MPSFEFFPIAVALLICVGVILALTTEPPTHKCRHEEMFGGLYADEIGGPRYYHEIWWECPCGDVIDRAAKNKARKADLREQGIPT